MSETIHNISSSLGAGGQAEMIGQESHGIEIHLTSPQSTQVTGHGHIMRVLLTTPGPGKSTPGQI